MTDSEEVKARRKAGMTAMQIRVRRIPWIRARVSPWEAAMSASFFFPAPRLRAMTALIPTPKPMPDALMKFWMGKTRDSAVMASSLILATKKLSTIL